jgi:hypothetical protein
MMLFLLIVVMPKEPRQIQITTAAVIYVATDDKNANYAYHVVILLLKLGSNK